MIQNMPDVLSGQSNMFEAFSAVNEDNSSK